MWNLCGRAADDLTSSVISRLPSTVGFCTGLGRTCCPAMSISRCLRLELPPPPRDAPCTALWHRSGCLRTVIPAWTTTHDTVAACFRCCLLDVRTRQTTDAAWWRALLQNSTSENSLGVETDPESVLLSGNTDMQFASVGTLHGSPMLKEPPPLSAARESKESSSLVVLHGNGDKEHLLMQLLSDPTATIQPLRTPITVLEVGDLLLPLKGPNGTQLLDAPGKIATWLANNPRMRHPRLQPYPRGLQCSPRWREALEAIRGANSNLQTLMERPRLLLCKCFNPSRPGRKQKMEHLVRNGFECSAHERSCGVRRTSYMERLLESKFVFSPMGLGHNNHRDWEALLAGAVPLVDYYDPLEPMWDTLPVVRVRDWSTITPSFMESEWERLHSEPGIEWTKVYWPYWLSKLVDRDAI